MRLAALAVLLLSFGSTVQAQTPGQLPPLPQNTPKVGEKAPDFTLPDTANKPVKLSDQLTPPELKVRQNSGGSWVLLIFYRGYW